MSSFVIVIKDQDGIIVPKLSTMRSTAALPLVIGLLAIESASSFQHQHYRLHVASRTRLASNEKDTLVPETSFGAEMVPEGQRPVNEYLEVIKSPMFDWASEESGTKGLLTRLAIVYGVTFGVIGYPIAGATFIEEGYTIQKIAASNVGTLGLVLVLLVRLYSGWGYVGSRLQSKTIEFEETGWYDGNIEEKTEAELRRDRFLYQSNVKPVVDRLKLFTLSSAGLWVASIIALNTAVSLKPTFNEYNPALLERVRYDDDLAGKAAQKSGGRPTYCESRYYRAIANGGQGC